MTAHPIKVGDRPSASGGRWSPRRSRSILVALTATLVAAASCTTSVERVREAADVAPGGTLRLGVSSDIGGVDPQWVTGAVGIELFRCCLLRTLLSYNGQPASREGTELRPDLADALPEISSDGRVWTFRLRPRIRYAPPYDHQSVTAQDVARALHRIARLRSPYSFMYEVIEGFAAVRDGRARAIEGLRVPDDRTLVVRLSRPVGDFGHRMAHPAAAPIPAADRDNDDRWLAALGPYMVEGSDALSGDAAPERPDVLRGYRPGRAITLVRNPSWEPDGLRLAYPDRIEVRFGVGEDDAARLVDAAELDLRLDGPPPAPQIRKYARDPQLQDRLYIHPSDAVRYLSMNLAVPPFDDVWVRRATNLAIDKQAVLMAAGDPHLGEIAGHIVPPTVFGERHAEYDPYGTLARRGDPEAARRAMRNSPYDTDGDGLCDRGCGVHMLAPAAPPFSAQAELIAGDLEQIGLGIEVVLVDMERYEATIRNPAEGAALILPPPWNKVWPDPGSYLAPLFSSSAIGPGACCNTSLVGAPPTTLRALGARVSSVPSVDASLARCEPLRDAERLECWIDLEERLMEEVVPVAPLYFANNVAVVSGRVTSYVFDQYAGLPSVDRVAVGDED